MTGPGQSSTAASGDPASDRIQPLRLLADIALLCNDSRGLAQIMREAVARVCALNGWFAGYAYLTSPRTDHRARLVASHRTAGAEGIEVDPALAPTWVDPGDGLLGAALVDCHPVWTTVAWDGRGGVVPPLHAAVIPIPLEEEVAGVLLFLSLHPPEHGDEMRMAFRSIGVVLGRAIERERLEAAAARAANAERRRIGRDLHDTVCQELVGLSLQADVLARRLRGADREEAERAAEIAGDARRTLDQVRHALAGLLPLGLERGGLARALARLATATESRYQVRCEARIETDVPDEHVATELYFIASEAVSNAVRHSEGSSIAIHLEPRGDSTLLEVHDDGVGMRALPPSRRGFGLFVMRHRARSIDALLSIVSRPGGGTSLRCEVPHHAISDPEARSAEQGDIEDLANRAD